MNPQTWARILIAVSFSISGLVETLGATGLVVELSPDGGWNSGILTLAVSGPLQLAGAAVLASGRKTRWALVILGGYALLVSAFGNLPLVLNPNLNGSALIGLLNNLAAVAGIVYWFHSERAPDAYTATHAPATMAPLSPLTVRLVLCVAVMCGIFYWLHGGQVQGSHRPSPAIPVTSPARVPSLRLLV